MYLSFYIIPILFIVVLAYLIRIILQKTSLEELNAISFPKKLIWTILLVAIGYNLFLHELVYTQNSILGIGFSLFTISLSIALLLSFPKEKRTLFVYSLAGTISLAGIFSAFRANEFTQSINILISMICVGLLFFIFSYQKIHWQGFWIVKNGLKFITKALRQIVVLLKLAFKGERSKKLSIIKWLKTIFIALIVLIFFINLLSSADPIFEKVIEGFKNQLTQRTIISIVILMAITLFLSLKVQTKEGSVPKLKILSFYDVVVPVICVIILFASFLFIEAKYLFGSHTDFYALDITYSDYVRKGFIELLITSFFGSLIVYLVILKAKILEDPSKVKILKILNPILIIELFAIMASAFKKDLMYVETYGVTRIRLIGVIFLCWLTINLLVMLVTALRKKMKEKVILKGIFVTSLLAFLTLNLFNIDSYIAKATPPEDMHKDYYYISQLSEDAVYEWKETILEIKKNINTFIKNPNITDENTVLLAESKLALLTLQKNTQYIENKFSAEEEFEEWIEEEYKCENDYNCYNYDHQKERQHEIFDPERKWQSFNYSEYNAYNFIQKEDEVFYDTAECLLEEIENIQITYLINLYDEMSNRIYDYKYPLINPKFREFTQVQYPALDSILNDALKEADLYENFKRDYSLDYDDYHTINVFKTDEF